MVVHGLRDRSPQAIDEEPRNFWDTLPLTIIKPPNKTIITKISHMLETPVLGRQRREDPLGFTSQPNF